MAALSSINCCHACTLALAAMLLLAQKSQICSAFTTPSSSSLAAVGATTSGNYDDNRIIALFASSDDGKAAGGTLFFAEEAEETAEAETTETAEQLQATTSRQLFSEATLAEANDALNSVGWSGVAPMQGEGEMTSDDPFVRQIDESIRGEMGVGLDELLNPAKVCSSVFYYSLSYMQK